MVRSFPTVALPALLACGALLSGCLHDSRPDPDDTILVNLEQQVHWAERALQKAPSADEVEAAQEGRGDASKDLARRFRALIEAGERCTWARDAGPRALADAMGDAELRERTLRGFQRAAEVRAQAFAAADRLGPELAGLWDDPLRFADLQRGLSAVAKAEEVEGELQAAFGTAAGSDPRLARAPSLVPRPFIATAGLWLHRHPEKKGDLDRLKGPLAQDAVAIRAAAAHAQLDAAHTPKAAASKGSAPKPPSSEPPASALALPSTDDPDRSPMAAGLPGSGAGPGSFTLGQDARKLWAKRGPPQSIAVRPGGQLALRYQEERPCGVERCQRQVDYLFDAQGKLLRDEVVEAAKAPQKP